MPHSGLPTMNNNRNGFKRNEWILCPSESFPGKYYYFNLTTGEAVWNNAAEGQRPPRPQNPQPDSQPYFPREPTNPKLNSNQNQFVNNPIFHYPSPSYPYFPYSVPCPPNFYGYPPNWPASPPHVMMTPVLPFSNSPKICTDRGIQVTDTKDFMVQSTSLNISKRFENYKRIEVENKEATQRVIRLSLTKEDIKRVESKMPSSVCKIDKDTSAFNDEILKKEKEFEGSLNKKLEFNDLRHKILAKRRLIREDNGNVNLEDNRPINVINKVSCNLDHVIPANKETSFKLNTFNDTDVIKSSHVSRSVFNTTDTTKVNAKNINANKENSDPVIIKTVVNDMCFDKGNVSQTKKELNKVSFFQEHYEQTKKYNYMTVTTEDKAIEATGNKIVTQIDESKYTHNETPKVCANFQNGVYFNRTHFKFNGNSNEKLNHPKTFTKDANIDNIEQNNVTSNKGTEMDKYNTVDAENYSINPETSENEISNVNANSMDNMVSATLNFGNGSSLKEELNGANDLVFGKTFESRKEEWICLYTQIMEDMLQYLLQPTLSKIDFLYPPPWTLLDGLMCLNTYYDGFPDIKLIIDNLLKVLHDLIHDYGRLDPDISCEDFANVVRCSLLLIKYIKSQTTDLVDVTDQKLNTLVTNIENPNYDQELVLPNVTIRIRTKDMPDDSVEGKTMTKSRAEVIKYLSDHFPAWKDYSGPENPEIIYQDNSENKDIKIIRMCGKNLKDTKIVFKRPYFLRSNREHLDSECSKTAIELQNGDELKKTTKVVRKLTKINENEQIIVNNVPKLDANENKIQPYFLRSNRENLDSECFKTAIELQNGDELKRTTKVVRKPTKINENEQIIVNNVPKLDANENKIQNAKDTTNKIKTRNNFGANISSDNKINSNNNLIITTNDSIINNDNKIITSIFDPKSPNGDSGLPNSDSTNVTILMNSFFGEVKHIFDVVQMFIKNTDERICRGSLTEENKRNHHMTTKILIDNIERVIDIFKKISEREAAGPPHNLLYMLQKIGVHTQDERILKHRQVIRKCTEQILILKSALKMLYSILSQKMDVIPTELAKKTHLVPKI